MYVGSSVQHFHRVVGDLMVQFTTRSAGIQAQN